MTPAARIQAAIELLDAIVVSARDDGAAADTLIARYFKDRRYAGSKDRRAVRDLVYAAIRRTGERPMSGRAAMIGVAADEPALTPLFDGSPHGPAPIDPAETVARASVVPAWLRARLIDTVGEAGLPALLARASLDIRVNRLRSDVATVAALLPEAGPGRHSPDALRLPEGFPIERSPAWEQGLVEIQDEGSQLIAAACAAQPGMTVIDLCAGAGGKTLALAAMMAGEGRLIAADIDRRRLDRLPPRARRAGAEGIETRLLDPKREAERLADLVDAADVVLVDAPCSGSGTWRRNPEARWRLTQARLDRLAVTQAHLLDLAAGFVRPGGALVYAVCSLLDAEGSAQAAGFLATHPGWTVEALPFAAGVARGSGRLLTPAADDTDGFFIARLHRPC